MTEDKILWTAQYVEGDLNETERIEFETLLTHDKELKQHLTDYYHIHSSLQMKLGDDRDRALLIGTLGTLNQEYFSTKTQPKVLKLSTYLRWASGVAAVLVLGILIWAPWRGNLYEQFNTAHQMTVAERGAEKTPLDIASEYFNDKRYTEAKPLLEKLYGKDGQNAMVAYYYGITLLETNQLAQGRELLENLYKGESVYKYDAAYSMAMSYLKEDKKADCKFWLEKIPDSAAQYSKAQELLKKL